MERILVIGCPGSGKSTFSRQLARRLKLPLIPLDQLNWQANGENVSKEVFRARLNRVLKAPRWIIDGNYGSTMDQRLARADAVIFLDYPVELCLQGVLARRGKPRPDLPWVEPADYVDEEFLDFIRAYPRHSRPQVLNLLEKHTHLAVIRFETRQEAADYLKKIKQAP